MAKKFIAVSCALSTCVVSLAVVSHRYFGLAEAASSGSRSPVIVELFTSEGCSSCPPAEALLSKLADSQSVQGAEVIALEEHVDYWNDLGWMDPFSSNEFTSRQQGYAERFGQGSVYTPQMVIDGSRELVGSRSREVRAIIEEAARGMKTEVKLEQRPTAKKDAVQFSVSTGKFGSEPRDVKVDMWVAVTERGLHSDVKRGENAGEDLHHAAVVRSLRVIGSEDSGKESSFTATLTVERGWKRENLLIVAFAQERKSKRIVGVAAVKIL